MSRDGETRGRVFGVLCVMERHGARVRNLQAPCFCDAELDHSDEAQDTGGGVSPQHHIGS